MLHRLKRLLPPLLWLLVESDCMMLSTSNSFQICLKAYPCRLNVLAWCYGLLCWIISLSEKSSCGLFISILGLSNSALHLLWIFHTSNSEPNHPLFTIIIIITIMVMIMIMIMIIYIFFIFLFPLIRHS